MKSFLKHLVIFFFGLVIFMALIDTGTYSSKKEEEVSNSILVFEETVANGEVVGDGVLNEYENLVVPNTISQGANSLGNSLVGVLASFLELIGETIYNFFA